VGGADIIDSIRVRGKVAESDRGKKACAVQMHDRAARRRETCIVEVFVPSMMTRRTDDEVLKGLEAREDEPF
jgi:hypothetical protein